MSMESETSRPHVAIGSSHHGLLIARLNPHDGLLGRDACFVYYVGNAVFRNELVKRSKEEYRAARFHEHKHAIAKEVYDQVYQSGGRFLARPIYGRLMEQPPTGETLWYVVAPDVALQNIKQALREKCANDDIVPKSTKETLPVALKAALQGTTICRIAGKPPVQHKQQQQPHDPQVKTIQAAVVVVVVQPELPVAPATSTLTSSKHDAASAHSSVPIVHANGSQHTTVRSLYPVTQPVPRLPRLDEPLSSFAPTFSTPTDSVAATTTTAPFGYPTQPTMSFSPPLDLCSHDVMPINRQRIELVHRRHRLLKEQHFVHQQIMLRQILRSSQQQPAPHRQPQNEMGPTSRNATVNMRGTPYSIPFRKVASPNSVPVAHHGLWNRALVATSVLPVALAGSSATVDMNPTTACLRQTNDAILDGAIDNSKPPAWRGKKRARLNGAGY